MRIILTGAPGSEKSKIYDELVDDTTRQLDVEAANYPHQLGDLADYRLETKLALDRASEILSRDNIVQKHSLLDSVAYASVRLTRLIENNNGTDQELVRWATTAQMAALLLTDSFKYDLILFVPGNDGTEFSQQIQIALRAILEELKLPFTELTTAEEAATLVREHGQRTDNQELDQQAAE